MLTNAAVKAARPRAAAYKLADERGLHLFVAPNGRRSFRWRFRWEGKEQLLTIGEWPAVSLDQARDRAELAREQLGRGEDPRTIGARGPEVRRFDDIARRWRWTAVHASDVLASLERDVFPAIGAMPLAAITAPVVLNALRGVEERGRLETARRVRQRISAVFVFAMSEDLVDSDPAARVGRMLTPPAPARHQPALLDIAEARQLLAAVDQVAAAPAIKLASQFLALTAVRLAAVRGARWSEIEDLDGAAPMWRVPATRMKLAAAKKGDAKNDHLVPLAPAAVEVLRAARAIMHSHDANMHALIFPGRGGDRPIGEAAIGSLYDRAGFAGRHVPHGWRATFATIMNEACDGADHALIDQALAHTPKNKVEAAYNRAALLDRRRALFVAWAEQLTEAPASTPVG
jgi:integrase